MSINIRPSNFQWILAGTSALAVTALMASGVALFLSAQSLRAPAAAKASEAAPARWSDIESPDEATFVARLRAMGCPEASISALLATRAAAPIAVETRTLAPVSTADRHQIAVQTVELSGVPARVEVIPQASTYIPQVSQAAVSIASAAMSDERGASSVMSSKSAAPVYAQNTDGSPNSARAASHNPARAAQATEPGASPDFAGNQNAEEQVITAPTADSVIPVAFETSAEKLSEPQASAVDTLQQQFVDDVGGANSAQPADPAAWQSALDINDRRYRTLFGNEAYLVQQAEARKRQ